MNNILVFISHFQQIFSDLTFKISIFAIFADDVNDNVKL